MSKILEGSGGYGKIGKADFSDEILSTINFESVDNLWIIFHIG